MADINVLDNRTPLWRIIIALAWPAIIQQFLLTIVTYVDTAMVGAIGVEATAAVGLTQSTCWLIGGFMNSVGVGYSVLMARRIGEAHGDNNLLSAAKKVIRQAVLAIIILGVIITLLISGFVAPRLPLWMGAEPSVAANAKAYLRIVGLSYLFNIAAVVCSHLLRCAGDSRTPLKFNLLTNLINVVGNFILIKHYGVAGAAAATSIATTFSGACLLRVLFTRDTPLRVSWRESFKPDFLIIRQAVRLAFPVILERFSIATGHLLSTGMITSLGTISLAAHQLASTGEAICYLPPDGFALAAMTLSAQSLGAGQKQRAFEASRWCVRLAVLIMIFSAGTMYALARPMIAFFTRDLATIELGARMLRLEVWAEPFMAATAVLCGVFRGAGDVRWPILIAISGMLVVRVPLIYILIYKFNWDLTAVWGAMIVDWLVKSMIASYRFYGRGWLDAWRIN